MDGRGPDRGWQEDGSEGGSSSRSNNVPANLLNYPNDPSLTGSSSHGSRPQGSGSTISFHTHDPSPVSYNQHDYHLVPQSGPTLSNQFLRGFQTDFTQAWPNQATGTQTPIDMTQYHSSLQYTPGDAPVGNMPHHVDRSSPFYPVEPMEPQDNTTVQPPRHQQHVIPHPRDRRLSFQQVHAPIPHQPDFASLSSPPRSNSSYSHTRPSPQRLGQDMPLPTVYQWPSYPGRSSRSTSNSTTGTYSYSNADPQDVVPSGNSGQASQFTSMAQLPPYSGETSSYSLYPPNNDPGDGPSFPVPHPAPPPAPAKGKGTSRSHPYPQSDRQTRKKVSRSDEPPVASGSNVTLDTPSPPTARRKQRDKPQTASQKKDAERKKDYRAKLGCWYKRIAGLLPQSRPESRQTNLQILIRVIEHLGGTAPEPVDHPKNLQKKWDGKSHANAVRAHNENRAYDRILELLQATGRFNFSSTTSHESILQIVAYLLSEMNNGVADEDLAEIIRKFLYPQGYGAL